LTRKSSGYPAPQEVFGTVNDRGINRRVEKLVYESEAGISIPALLLVPATGKAHKPAIVLADAAGKSAAAGEAAQLAARGYVLAADLRGFGETQPGPDRRDNFVRAFGDYQTALTALLIGKTIYGRNACRRRGRSRVSVTGRSAAALPALFAALFDSGICSLTLDGMLVSYEAVVNNRINRGMIDQIVPSALKYFDSPDVIAAIAPRRVAVFNGVNPLGQEEGCAGS